jgi:hypothetical protein
MRIIIINTMNVDYLSCIFGPLPREELHGVRMGREATWDGFVGWQTNIRVILLEVKGWRKCLAVDLTLGSILR